MKQRSAAFRGMDRAYERIVVVEAMERLHDHFELPVRSVETNRVTHAGRLEVMPASVRALISGLIEL